MVVSYFILNFMPLMILLALAAMMYVNRNVKIPAIINALIFSTALFGSHIAFFIGGDNRWYGGPLRR
ncbi:MAG: hypothetical protein IKR39_02295 [Lachnospiraceae bacterium]|nr:hypothetical protein [Lachnospiraceae bacterium]